MIYYYFTLAFILLASFAVCGLSSAYHPELFLKKSITVKNEGLRKFLKIDNTEKEATEKSEYIDKVTVFGISLKFVWLLFTALSLITLFCIKAVPITDEHSTALVMPAVLTTFNQKLAHYINLSFLLISSALCILNSYKSLYKQNADEAKGKTLIVRIAWCAVAILLLCFGIYIVVKCIQLLSFF